ncbi:MAG: AAA family ATPase [Actinomycetota bacterium]
MDRADAHSAAKALDDNISSVIRGKPQAVHIALMTLFAGGHLLIEDVPGMGKTMLARSIARSIHGTFKRIQATPDLLPSDVTGANIYNQAAGAFEFMPGPVFANVVLIDEINRTTPRTQSALLEAMDEAAVTVDGKTYALPSPLFIVATQNPIEHHGTYPLPEGQLDRFAVSMDIGYLTPGTEREVVRAQLAEHPIESLKPVVTTDDIAGIQDQVRKVHVAEPVLGYALALVAATRDHPEVELGASPRSSVMLVRMCQARALMSGRDFIVPDDVKALAAPALAHRVLPVAGARSEPRRMARVINELLERTPVPILDA